MNSGNSPPASTSVDSVYEKLNASNDLQGMVAYAVYQKAKREWIAKSRPAADDISKYKESITETQISLYLNDAQSRLANFAEAAIAESADIYKQEGAQSAIVAEVKRQQSFWKSLGVNVIGSVVFSVVLVLFWIALNAPSIQDISKRVTGASP
jgi:hypothetical protein